MAEITREKLLIAVISGRGPAYLRGIDLSKLDLTGAGWLVEADLRHANLASSNLSRVNLRDSKLEKANLEASVLVGANLEGADLRGARLSAANLRMANLCGASLQGAMLIGAVLTKANLQGANLEGADLEGADMQGADIRNAKLQGANLKMANIQNISLASAIRESTPSSDPQHTISLPVSKRGFSGSLNGIGLAELLQLVCLSHSDLFLQVDSPSGRGAIHVRSGKVCHAETADCDGEDAFFKILRWDNGHFEALPLHDNCVDSIDKPIEHLLFESYRLRDESFWNEDLVS